MALDTPAKEGAKRSAKASLKHSFFDTIILQGLRPYGWLLLLGVIVFGRTLFYDFTYFVDDTLIFKDYDFISRSESIIPAFGKTIFAIYYRPLAVVSLILDAQISGQSAIAYHGSSLLYHFITCGLVFLLLTKLKYSRSISFLCSALFTVHPLTTMAVAWIPGANDTLLALFLILSTIMLIEFLEKKKGAFYLLHIASFALALFTKESAAIFPILFLMYAILISKEKFSSRNLLILLAGWSVAGACWFFFRSAALANAPVTGDMPSVQYVTRNLPTLLELTGKFFIPVNLSAYGIFSPVSTILGSIIVLVLITIMALQKKMRTMMAIFGIVWFIAMNTPSLLVWIKPIDYFEFRAYISLIGIVIFVAEIISVSQNFLQARAIPIFMIIIPLFSVLTFVHEENFENKISFWSHISERFPTFAEPYGNLAEAYEQDPATVEQAESAYRKAIELAPEKTEYHNNLGSIYARKREYAKASREFSSSLKVDTSNAFAYYNLGAIAYLESQPVLAESLWKKAIEIKPDFKECGTKLIALLFREKKNDEAYFYIELMKKQGISLTP